MNMALITTASALVVAIPCYIAYNYLVARVNSITLDMEKASLEISGGKAASAQIQSSGAFLEAPVFPRRFQQRIPA